MPVGNLINLILDSNMLRKLSLGDVRPANNPSNRKQELKSTGDSTGVLFIKSQPEEDHATSQGTTQDFINIHSLKATWHLFRADPNAEAGLERWIAKHEITELFHFSPLENLGGILRQGLVTILELKLSRSTFKANDHDRYDETGGICTSLGFPNYKLLYRAKIEKTLQPVILRISPKALFEIPWIAVPTNAATKEMRNFLRNKANNLVGLEALSRLFVDEVPLVQGSLAKRKQLGLPASFPTDPQAEVIFLERIPPHLILSLCVPDETLATKVSEAVRSANRAFNVEKRPDLYKSRRDFQFWTGGKRLRLDEL
jgi:hypothetical protein